MKINNIDNNDGQLDNLFQSARSESPKYAFTEASSVFTSALAIGVATAAHAKAFTSTIFKSKIFIMSISTVAIVSGALIGFSLTGISKQKSNKEIFKSENVVNKNTIIKAELAFNSSENENQEQSKNSSKLIEKLAVNPLLNTNPFLNLKPNLSLFVPKQLLSNLKQDTLYIKHNITEKSTDSELEKIKEAAAGAGIDFSYKIKRRGKTIRNLSYVLKKETELRLYKSVKVKTNIIEKDFSLNIEWRTDENGKVIDFDKFVPGSKYTRKNKVTDKTLARLERKTDRMKDNMEVISLNTKPLKPQSTSTDIKASPKSEKSSSDETFSLISHIIDPATSEEQIQKIQKAAFDAGIIFKYSMSYKKDEIKRLEIEMKLHTEDGSMRSDVRIYKKRGELFSVPVIWQINNANGKAVNFGNPNQIQFKDML